MLERAKVNPNLLLEQQPNIVALTKQYGFNDISLAKPSPIDYTNVLFIVGKQPEQKNNFIRFCVDLHKILDVDAVFEITSLGADIRPDFFNEYYKDNMLSLLTASVDDVKSFLKEKLNIEVTNDQPSNKQATVSQMGKFSNNNYSKEPLFEEKENTYAKKLGSKPE